MVTGKCGFLTAGFVFFALMACLVFAGAAPGEEAAAPSAVVNVEGAPKIMKAGTDRWISCEKGMAVENGDRIKTAKDEFVDMAMGENIISVKGDSDVLVKKTVSPYYLELLSGELMSLIKRLPKKSTFEVKTPAGLCGARGTGWKTGAREDSMTADVHEESIFMRGLEKTGELAKEETVIEEGWRAMMRKFEKPSLIERLTDKDRAEWNTWKQETTSRVEESKAAGESRGSGGPGGPGGPGGGAGGEGEAGEAGGAGAGAAERGALERRIERAEGIAESVAEKTGEAQETRRETKDVTRIEERESERRETTSRESTSGGGYATSP